MEREYARVSRLRVKRALLDHLAGTCRFEVPAGMVELEFEAIWQQLGDRCRQGDEEASRGRSAEYRDIAERRVRLGRPVGCRLPMS
jgi:trigger factor